MVRYLAYTGVLVGATLCVTDSRAGSYNLCLGEYWQDGRHGGPICPAPGGNQVYGYCYSDPEKIAVSLCAQEHSTGTPTVVQTGVHGGNKCGYTFYVLTCQ